MQTSSTGEAFAREIRMMSYSDNLRSRLLREHWQFSRVGGEIFSANLRLLPNGRIGNYSHPNEYSWRLTDEALEFCTQDGIVTTRFNLADATQEGSLKMTGKVLVAPPDQPGFHALEALGTAWGRGQPLLQKPRVAVFIRTHLANEKLHHLINSLNGSPLFDLYVLADETRGALPLTDSMAPVLSHSIEMCASLGLKTNPSNHENALWLCGDYALYCGVSAQPNYDYYFMIEYDVHFTRENPFLLEALINRLQSLDGQALDLICGHIAPIGPTGDWYKQAARLYENVYWGGLFAVIAVSKRAAQRLLEVRQAEGVSANSQGELTHCEAFVLTTIMNHPEFRCKAINDIIPNCVNGQSYYASSPSSYNFLLGGKYSFRPNIEMVHPVLDAEEYLRRLLSRYKIGENTRPFVEHLNGLGAELVARDIRERFLKRAHDHNQAQKA
ncbi:MAG: hypothetical protein V4460_00505 [Pseudomonadota bacterium]|jgi:hypothetical protein